MLYQKICEHCGKIFVSERTGKIYCSKDCKREANKKRIEEKSQPYWVCTKACGGCNWSRYLIPVEGWKAIEHTMHSKKESDSFRTYRILYCPEFNHE